MKEQNPRRQVTKVKTSEWHDTEMSHQGLRILARMVARRYLEKEVARRTEGNAS